MVGPPYVILDKNRIIQNRHIMDGFNGRQTTGGNSKIMSGQELYIAMHWRGQGRGGVDKESWEVNHNIGQEYNMIIFYITPEGR